MKRGLILCLIGLLLIGGVVWEQIFIKQTINDLNNKIDVIQTNIISQNSIDTEENRNLIDELDKYWTFHESKLCLTVNHKDMEKIGESIIKTKAFIEQDRKEDAEQEVNLLKYMAENFSHYVDFTFENLL